MKLAVIFPGIGYHVDKPLLYFAKKLAEEAGYQVVETAYGNFPPKVKGSGEKMKKSLLMALEQSEEILKDIDFSSYEDILFISKSVGTAVAAVYAQKHSLNTRNIYYTPVQESLVLMKNEGIVFHGTADDWADTDVLERECRKNKFPLYITENGTHSLETGDVIRDLENLAQIMRVTKEYIG